MNEKNRQKTADWLGETQGEYERLKFLVKTAKKKEKIELQKELDSHVAFMKGDSKMKKKKVKTKKSTSNIDWFF